MTTGNQRRVIWLGASLDSLKSFPQDVRRDLGYQLGRVQRRLNPDNWKPMSGIGSGVREIRVTEEGRTFRLLYVVKDNDLIYVLHTFEKKSRKTRRHDLDLARRRLRGIEEMTVKQTPSSGNVFRDMGFDPDEAANLQIRSDLMIAITETIRERGLTQVEAAGIMGVTQPRISDLMRGKINLFSVDALIALASALGLKVTVGVEAS